MSAAFSLYVFSVYGIIFKTNIKVSIAAVSAKSAVGARYFIKVLGLKPASLSLNILSSIIPASAPDGLISAPILEPMIAAYAAGAIKALPLACKTTANSTLIGILFNMFAEIAVIKPNAAAALAGLPIWANKISAILFVIWCFSKARTAENIDNKNIAKPKGIFLRAKNA